MPIVASIEPKGRIVFDAGLDLAEWPSLQPYDDPTELFGFEVWTDDLGARFEPGTVVYFAKPPQMIWQAFLGTYCACRLVDGDTVLAMLQAGSRPGLFRLQLPSGEEWHDRELQWATPIRFMRFCLPCVQRDIMLQAKGLA